MRRFVAPGKVVLLGEYAVVDGAPALVAAVDRGVACSVSRSDGLTIQSPAGDAFVWPALRSAEAPPAWYSFSAWNPVPLSAKPGLGHSAAAVVVAILAARTLKGLRAKAPDLFAAASLVHREVQGSGSGIDVAASAWGGVIRFEGRAATPARRVEPVIIWSGSSAKTGPRVEAYQAWKARSRFVRRSGELVEQFESDPIRALDEARRLLEDMAAKAHIEYQTPALDRIAALAADHGGAAKPSGAGGGDVAVALFADPDAQRAFERAVQRAGFAVIPSKLAEGAHEEEAS
jgi:phosphomevalonate kinase